MMDIRQINHIGIAVKDLDQALHFWQKILGLPCEKVLTLPERGLKIAFLVIGNVTLELLAPLDEKSQISAFLEKRGEGFHHICLEVSDLTRHQTILQKEGVKVLSEKPEIGAEGYPITFVHPKSTCGVLLELLEKKDADGPVK